MDLEGAAERGNVQPHMDDSAICAIIVTYSFNAKLEAGSHEWQKMNCFKVSLNRRVGHEK